MAAGGDSHRLARPALRHAHVYIHTHTRAVFDLSSDTASPGPMHNAYALHRRNVPASGCWWPSGSQKVITAGLQLLTSVSLGVPLQLLRQPWQSDLLSIQTPEIRPRICHWIRATHTHTEYCTYSKLILRLISIHLSRLCVDVTDLYYFASTNSHKYATSCINCWFCGQTRMSLLSDLLRTNGLQVPFWKLMVNK